jgi:bifunctional lysine-specific demethylase and histidyl-hydroxylase NO66
LDVLDLLTGDSQTFREKVWGSRVHLHHADPAALVGHLSLDDADRLLTSSALRTPTVRVVKDGSVLPASAYTRSATLAGASMTGLLDGRKVLALFGEGATVVLQGLHRYWPPLTELVRGLELALGHPCQANAYLTPPGSQGFARHSDTHDVFVFQTHGHKQWQLVEEGQERDVLLEPGLSMYLPTGTPHSARSEDETSLHVTIGVNQLTWRTLLRRVADRALADERYAGPLPAGYLEDPTVLAGPLRRALDDLSSAVQDVDAAAAAAAQADDFLTGRTPALRGGLTDLVRLDAITDETRLLRRRTAACVLRPGPDRLVVLLGDRELRMPLRLEAPLAFVRDRDSFTVGELAPWLDAPSRMVVARRLVREGLLALDTTEEPGAVTRPL